MGNASVTWRFMGQDNYSEQVISSGYIVPMHCFHSKIMGQVVSEQVRSRPHGDPQRFLVIG